MRALLYALRFRWRCIVPFAQCASRWMRAERLRCQIMPRWQMHAATALWAALALLVWQPVLTRSPLPAEADEPGPEIAGAGLSLSLDLAAGGARPNPVVLDTGTMATCGTIATGAIMPKGGALTVTRNAAESYVCADGVTRSAGINTLGVVESGAQVYGAYTEVLLRTGNPVTGTAATSPWLVYGATAAPPTLSVESIVDPTGATSSVARVDVPAIAGAGQASLFGQPFTTSAAQWTVSTHIKSTGSACTTYIALAGSAAVSSAVSVTSTWQRVSLTRTSAAETEYLWIGASGLTGYGQPTTQAACSFYIYSPNAAATSVLMPAVAAGASPVAQPATDLRPPVTPSALASWCVAFTGAHGLWYTPGVYGKLWGLGSDGAANSSSIQMEASSVAGFYFDVYDSAGSLRRAHLLDPSFAANSAHSITCCFDGSTPTITVDGTLRSLVISGSHNGSAIPAGTAVYIGNAVTGTRWFNGFVSRFKICKSSNPGRCQ